MTRITTILTGLLLALGTHQALAAMYKWTDEAGNVHYTQRPPNDRPTQVIKAPPPPPANRGYTPPKLGAAKKDERPGESPEQAAEREALLKKNCDAARNNLEVYTAHRRIQEGEGAEVIVLDDDERNRRIQQAQENIKKYCK